MNRTLNYSAPDPAPLFVDEQPEPDEEDTRVDEVVDLSAALDAEGVLRWDFPEGRWEILRLGCTIGDHSRVSTCSEGWEGYALDVLDAGAFQRYWDAVVEPLILDAGPLAGKTLKYLHTTDGWSERSTGPPRSGEEFRKRSRLRFPAVAADAGRRIVKTREESKRVLPRLSPTSVTWRMTINMFVSGERPQHGLLSSHPAGPTLPRLTPSAAWA